MNESKIIISNDNAKQLSTNYFSFSGTNYIYGTLSIENGNFYLKNTDTGTTANNILAVDSITHKIKSIPYTTGNTWVKTSTFNSYTGTTNTSLANKVDKSNSVFRDGTDLNKQIHFDLSTITSGQNWAIKWRNAATDIGNISTVPLTFNFAGNSGILQVGVQTNYFRIPYNATIVGWTLYEASKIPVSTTSTIGVYKKSSFYPTSADVILSPSLTAATNNSVTGLNISVSVGDVFAAEITVNNNAANLILILTLIKG